MATVTVKTFTNSIAAHLAKDRLEAAGIDCFLADENVSRAYPTGIFEIRLMVAEEDLPRALEVLQDN